MTANYTSRIDRVVQWMKREALSALLFVDEEGRREPAIRYLTGHPSDAVLFVLADGRTILIPWDAILAGRVAKASEIIPYTSFERSLLTAFEKIAKREGLSGAVEVGAGTPYPLVGELAMRLPGGKIVCRDKGVDRALLDLRAVKDGGEIERLKSAARLTNDLLGELEGYIAGSKERTEVDVALFIEQEARSRGAEGLGFASLVAGPARSWGIHAFPNYSGGPFATAGMSILDFGVVVDGYPSDVTVTVLRGHLSSRQQLMVELVEEAYERAAVRARPGVESYEVAMVVDDLFRSKGFSMPHSLGHGIGLEIHEAPFLRTKRESSVPLLPGMVFTLEPGLYDETEGGVRLENDFIVTDQSTEVLTTARILRLP